MKRYKPKTNSTLRQKIDEMCGAAQNNAPLPTPRRTSVNGVARNKQPPQITLTSHLFLGFSFVEDHFLVGQIREVAIKYD